MTEETFIHGAVTTTCFAIATSGQIITGNSEGAIYVWKEKVVEKVLKEKHVVSCKSNPY